MSELDEKFYEDKNFLIYNKLKKLDYNDITFEVEYGDSEAYAPKKVVKVNEILYDISNNKQVRKLNTILYSNVFAFRPNRRVDNYYLPFSRNSNLKNLGPGLIVNYYNDNLLKTVFKASKELSPNLPIFAQRFSYSGYFLSSEVLNDRKRADSFCKEGLVKEEEEEKREEELLYNHLLNQSLHSELKSFYKRRNKNMKVHLANPFIYLNEKRDYYNKDSQSLEIKISKSELIYSSIYAEEVGEEGFHFLNYKNENNKKLSYGLLFTYEDETLISDVLEIARSITTKHSVFLQNKNEMVGEIVEL